MGLVWFLTLAINIAPRAQVALLGDVDGNFVANLADLPSFVPCMAGPASPPPSQCQHADLNADGRVDLAERIKAALRQSNPGKLAFVLNTYDHGDHTGAISSFAATHAVRGWIQTTDCLIMSHP